MESHWIIAARLLQITLSLITLGITIYLIDRDGWWGYNTRLYEFATSFLVGSTALFGSFSLCAFLKLGDDSAFLTFCIDVWAVAYLIASGVLLRICSKLTWLYGVSFAAAVISFIDAALVIALILRSAIKAWTARSREIRPVLEDRRYADDESSIDEKKQMQDLS